MGTLSRLARADIHPSLHDFNEKIPIDQEFDEFLDLFENLRGLVPSSFFLLFKIARVLKTPDGKLNGQLHGFFDICRESDRQKAIDEKKAATIDKDVPIFSDHDPQFGIRRIKGIEEIREVNPNDVAIEDFTTLLRKAEEKELRVRVLMHGNEAQTELETAPIRDGGAHQMTNAAEQKLYILFDRSYSMAEHHRLLFAKILTIEFLRRKKSSGARLFFRAFDYQVYQVEKVGQAGQFDNLVRKLLFIEPGGKGTDIQLAIMTAAEDIKFEGMYENAEILLITDGCDRIELDTVKEALGEKIKLHMVKVGRDSTEPSQTEVKEMMAEDHSLSAKDRDEIAVFYKKRLMQQWDDISETLVETDDLDEMEIQLGEEEIQFVLAAAKKTVSINVNQLTSAEIESSFRQASFIEGFLSFLLARAEGSEVITAHKRLLSSALEQIRSFKIQIGAKNQMLANLLASKDLKFVQDRTLRRMCKKTNLSLEDLANLSNNQEIWLKLKMGQKGAPSGGKSDISLWRLMQLIAKSMGKSMTNWFFKEKEPENPPEKKEKKPAEKKDNS